MKPCLTLAKAQAFDYLVEHFEAIDDKMILSLMDRMLCLAYDLAKEKACEHQHTTTVL